jgi:cold-inducible RNA-binding protein
VKIYVGNLPFETTDESLAQEFEVFGEVVSANVVVDRASGRSRGFGFVEMPAQAEAEAAIAGLNGKELMGRALTVNESKPREGSGGGGGGGFGGGQRRRY